MKKKFLTVILLVSSFILYGCGQSVQIPSNEVKNIPTNNQSDSDNANIPIDNNASVTPSVQDTALGKNVVEITSEGFNPNILTINVGDKVEFINKDSSPHWPASGKHPIHNNYPGSGIEKCGTPEQVNIFDACKGLVQGEVFSFVFKEKGTWLYHDHLNPSMFGKIAVN